MHSATKYFHLLLSIPMYSYVSDGELGLSRYHTIHFLISSFCYIHNSCCFEHGDLLYIDLTLQFAQGRHVLYTFSYTDLSRSHVQNLHPLTRRSRPALDPNSRASLSTV